MNEFYRGVYEQICLCTGLTLQEILHSRAEQATDARSLLIFILSGKLSNKEITLVTGLPKQTVSQHVNTYQDRKKMRISLRWLEKDVEKKIEEQTQSENCL